MNKDLTIRGMVIGAIGSAIITMSSMFVALKLSSLPWPIMFVTLVSMFSLKLFGNTNNNEINVTQTAMSAGAMVAGGLAFTVPGIWILNKEAQVDFWTVLIITLCGVALGLIFTALTRKHFVEDKKLPYVMGQAAAETLKAGDEGGSKAVKLFVSLGVAAAFTALRDWVKAFPGVVTNSKLLETFGSSTGIWFSPMLIAIGYMIGPVAVLVWFIGGLVGDTGILVIGQSTGLFDNSQALQIKESLGIGLMIGVGVAILIKTIFKRIKKIVGQKSFSFKDSVIPFKFAAIVMACVMLVLTLFCDFGVIPSLLAIFGVWFATSMSSQSVGESSVNPMEIFGIFVLLFIRLFVDVDNINAFYIAALVAVASGLCGDVMNDFRVGTIFNTNPRKQWIGEAIGGIVGAFVAVFVLFIIVEAYGTQSFGSEIFPAAQSKVVATMLGGVSNMPALIIGIVVAAVLYFVGLPVITLGLGVYLPFYMSITVAVGAVCRLIVNIIPKKNDESGMIIASGLLGGESLMGVVMAIFTVFNIF